MSKINELRTQRAKTWEQAKAPLWLFKAKPIPCRAGLVRALPHRAKLVPYRIDVLTFSVLLCVLTLTKT